QFNNPKPDDTYEDATPTGYVQNRFWDEGTPDNLEALIERRTALLKRRFADTIAAGQPIKLSYLALSGGGADGAFGAGLLNGWTRSGTRPEFEMVTGISTGALIAPFAFLGPEWDDKLKVVFTTLTTDSILILDIFQALTGGLALADATPFRQIIERMANEEMFQAIAAEHRKGRRLFVGTSALDAARPVVWDIGAIANSGVPGAQKLFHDIVQASASIPGAFPPMLIDVEVDGKQYSELHVDGGVTSQVFAYPAQIELKDFDKLIPTGFDRTVYVIRNTTDRPPYENIRPRLLPLASRSISVLIAYQGIGDLYRIASKAKRDGIDFKLASIPGSWDMEPEEAFDQKYMTALFALGEQMGREGIPWRSKPLAADPEAEIAATN
ncbi:MAG: patatin-like phospholipase family protein, partial [Alphaproteobacteria bacterium]|nr:patatin-like phospholipase family protein [Alphaproteobacteria bacterium]